MCALSTYTVTAKYGRVMSLFGDVCRHENPSKYRSPGILYSMTLCIPTNTFRKMDWLDYAKGKFYWHEFVGLQRVCANP
ncbi:unnamed protein product [Dibothriocephalus latus]|uniref:Uncharacterized protein n=1 Tax=Dibothriocephalus latus TaxID=60516 RepID=A0A3P7LLC7_DIBLA|nr:unnamed protein product [Dibothriocephalus latus]